MLRPLSKALIAEIDITSMCTHRCSNCTRMVSHRRKPYIMDFPTFRKAVDSLLEFKGAIGIIGGEPTLHPEFDKFSTYLREAQGGRPLCNGLDPMTDIVAYRNKNFARADGKKRALFTSLGSKFYEHMEVIWETYDFIGMNDHTHQGEHQALMVASEELPLSQQEFEDRKNNCWLFNLWSPSVTPAGCYVCEVAAQFDMLFNDGKMAKPIEPNWWKRDLDYFKDQFEWCKKCGVAFNAPSRRANESIQDVTPGNLELLKKIDSPAVRHGRYSVYDVSKYNKNGDCNRPTELYLPKQNNTVRMASTNKSVFPKKIEALTVSVGMADFLDLTLRWNIKHFNKYVVVTSSDDKDSQEVAKKYGATLVISDRHKENGANFNKGKLINDGAKCLDYDDWVLLLDVDVLLPSNFRAEFDKHVWNPGALYYATRLHTPNVKPHEWVERYQKDESLAKTLKFSDPTTNRMPWGYFQMFNCRAKSIKSSGRAICSEDFTSAGGIDKHFLEKWTPSKRRLSPFSVIHIYHGGMGGNWTGRKSPALHFQPTVPIVSNEWLNVAWLDESGYNTTYPTPAGGFIKLVRVDTGEFIIARNAPASKGGWIRGDFGLCAHHCGVISNRYCVSAKPAYKGKIIIQASRGREFSGWGMGHVMYEDDRQGYVWAGNPIKPTKFDVFWKKAISGDDQRFLVR